MLNLMLWLWVVSVVMVKCSVLVLWVMMLFGNFLCVVFLIFGVFLGFIRLVVCLVIRFLIEMLLMMFSGLSMLFLDLDIFWFCVLWIRLVMYMFLNGILLVKLLVVMIMWVI